MWLWDSCDDGECIFDFCDEKDSARDDADDKDDIDFENDNGVKGEFFQINFVSIFTTDDSNLSFPDSVRCL